MCVLGVGGVDYVIIYIYYRVNFLVWVKIVFIEVSRKFMEWMIGFYFYVL